MITKLAYYSQNYAYTSMHIRVWCEKSVSTCTLVCQGEENSRDDLYAIKEWHSSTLYVHILGSVQGNGQDIAQWTNKIQQVKGEIVKELVGHKATFWTYTTTDNINYTL